MIGKQQALKHMLEHVCLLAVVQAQLCSCCWCLAKCHLQQWFTAHSFSGASGVCGGMDPKPDRLEASGEIWVGGRWPGFDAWVREKPELVIINCMHQKFAGPNNFWLHVNSWEEVDGKDWWQRHREAFLLFVRATAQRRPVLIHCMHGLHRTGAFASLCQALRVWMNSSEQKLWSECLMHGWQTFCSGRKLKERSVGAVKRNGRPRNFAFESWRATTELYGALTLVQLRWLTESVASVESVASATAALATATQDMAHQIFSNSRLSPSPPQRQQQQQKQAEEEEEEEKEDEEEEEEEEQKEEEHEDEEEKEEEEREQQEEDEEEEAGPQTKKSRESAAPWEGPPWKIQRVDIKLGDWICHKCGNHNFNRRGYCNGRHGGCKTPRDAGWKPGDWYCACGNWNLNWRGWCNRAKCNKSRAEDEQKP